MFFIFSTCILTIYFVSPGWGWGEVAENQTHVTLIRACNMYMAGVASLEVFRPSTVFVSVLSIFFLDELCRSLVHLHIGSLACNLPSDWNIDWQLHIEVTCNTLYILVDDIPTCICTCEFVNLVQVFRCAQGLPEAIWIIIVKIPGIDQKGQRGYIWIQMGSWGKYTCICVIPVPVLVH